MHFIYYDTKYKYNEMQGFSTNYQIKRAPNNITTYICTWWQNIYFSYWDKQFKHAWYLHYMGVKYLKKQIYSQKQEKISKDKIRSAQHCTLL